MFKKITKLVIKKYKPDIIGITGSVGKTSTKEAVFAVLKTKYRVQQNDNYDNLDLTGVFINYDNKSVKILKNFWLFLRGLKLLFKKDKNFPQVFVLDLPATQTGDIKNIVQLLSFKIGLITAIDRSHLENFTSLDKMIREISYLVSGLGPDRFLILNRDDQDVFDLMTKSKAAVKDYGFADESGIRASEVVTSILKINNQEKEEVEKIEGQSFKLTYQGSTVPVHLPRVLGRQHIYAALAGAAVGLIYNLNILEISQGLNSYQPPRGRINLIPGVKNTLIIDDTFNASPLSAKASLEVLANFELPAGRQKFVVLGDMAGLGGKTEDAHYQLGQRVARLEAASLVAVGEKSRDIIRGAKDQGMPDDFCFHFPDTEQAGKFIQNKMKKGDLIFIDGSAAMRMEKIVKELMAEPLRAPELLVRR